MHLLPRSLDTKIGRSMARRRFPAPTSSDLSFAPHLDGITDEELRFFARNGYLVRRDVIPRPLVEFARRYAWSLYPRRFHRDRPHTWRGRVRDSLGTRSLRRRHGRFAFRDQVRKQGWLYELIANHASVCATARGLLGRAVQRPEHVRGIESVFPSPVCSSSRPRPHTDSHAFLLGTTTYLDEVEPGGGGFAVWPGSHFTMRLGYQTAAGPGWAPDYQQRLYRMASRQAATEITGGAGTVIFWHHRLAHGSAFNMNGDRPRHAAFVDFSPSTIDRLIRQPIPIDPWRDWAIDGGLQVN